MIRNVAIAIVAALLLVLPLFAGDFYVNLASQILIAAIFALSLNLLVGFGGMTSLGHASFLGVAAYASALLTTRYGLGNGAGAILALAGTTAMAACFGLIALRASGLGFLMITLALSQVPVGPRLPHVERHQRRQRHLRHDPAGAFRDLARGPRRVLLVYADRLCRFVRDDGDLHLVVVRLVVERRPRPAAPDGGAWIQFPG